MVKVLVLPAAIAVIRATGPSVVSFIAAGPVVGHARPCSAAACGQFVAFTD